MTLSLIHIQGDEFRNGNYDNNVPKRDGILESIETFTKEFNLRFSQQMDSMMAMMHSQINGAISSAISDGVIPETLNIVSSMSSTGDRDIGASSSPNKQEIEKKQTG